MPDVLAALEALGTAARARTDWRSDDIHMVVWDETNESGMFGGASGLVAATPLDFNVVTGEIIDADIVLNGQRLFSTKLEGGRFDGAGAHAPRAPHLDPTPRPRSD